MSTTDSNTTNPMENECRGVVNGGDVLQRQYRQVVAAQELDLLHRRVVAILALVVIVARRGFVQQEVLASRPTVPATTGPRPYRRARTTPPPGTTPAPTRSRPAVSCGTPGTRANMRIRSRRRGTMRLRPWSGGGGRPAAAVDDDDATSSAADEGEDGSRADARGERDGSDLANHDAPPIVACSR